MFTLQEVKSLMLLFNLLKEREHICISKHQAAITGKPCNSLKLEMRPSNKVLRMRKPSLHAIEYIQIITED